MGRYETLDEMIARRCAENPEYAKAHAIGRPFLHLSLNVWSLRLTQGLTQQQLAGAAEMSQPRIATIERDEANPTLQTISRIAFALGVTADRLLAEPDEAVMASARALVAAEVAAWSPQRRRAYGLVDDSEQQPEPVPIKRRRKTA
jgi:transcriptional regulator with XRE-family HTH domain